jgi:(2R)-phospho-3-sulfolactate synthase (ComA)
MNHERAFSFIPLNAREAKPRRRGITEIRGPYYSVMGERYLTDVLETMGWYVDGLKFAGGSFALMPRQRVKDNHRLGARAQRLRLHRRLDGARVESRARGGGGMRSRVRRAVALMWSSSRRDSFLSPSTISFGS